MVGASALRLEPPSADSGHALRGFSFHTGRNRFDSKTASSPTVQPATGCCLFPPCPTSFGRAPLSDLPCPTAPSDSPATTLRFQPQVSTTSTVSHRHRGHPSGKSLQAYFIPQALLGLPFRGFSSNAGSETSATDFPSCRSQWPLASRAVLGIQREAWVDFRVLPNIGVRSHRQSALAQPPRSIPSWVFSSLGFFLPKTMGSLRRHLSCTCQSRTPLRVLIPGVLQSLLRLRWSNPLSRFRSPF